MKILYAASTISHINSFHKEYIRALRSEGHSVYIMASGEGADFNIPFEKKLFSRGNRKCRKKIKEILKKESFDAVILNTSLAAFHIRLAMGRHRPRVINIVHGYLFPLNAHGISAHLRRAMLLFAERYLRAKTDAIITMNGEDAEIAQKYKLTRGEILTSLGMGVKAKKPVSKRSEVRERLCISDDFVIGFVGELSSRKNQEYIIKALPKIREEIPNAKLMLIGEGELREKFISLSEKLGVADSLVLTGKRDNVADYIHAADIYLSASKIEGLPFNIVEALHLGSTVLASDIKGHRDILSGGGGVLFDLTKDDLPSMISMVKNGYIKINPDTICATAQRYSFDEVFPKTSGLILDLIASLSQARG